MQVMNSLVQDRAAPHRLSLPNARGRWAYTACGCPLAYMRFASPSFAEQL